MLKKFIIIFYNTHLLLYFFFFFFSIISIYQSKNFELDASADTLLIENDPDLIYLRELNKKYKSEEFFIITYTPKNLTKENSIKELQDIVNQINNFKWISKTVSIINAPLLQSTNEPLIERIKNLKYITNENIDLDKALKELTSSPVYKDLIISSDAKTYGIVAYLKDNKQYLSTLEQKTQLLNSEDVNIKKLNLINKKIKKLQKQQSNNIKNYNKSIKNLLSNYKSNAEIRLSGIPMIADDMITFIKKDIIVFGFGVFIFIILTLWLVFKNFKLGIFSFINLCSFNYVDDWIFKYSGLESDSNILKFYSIDVNFNYVYEYSLPCKVYAN